MISCWSGWRIHAGLIINSIPCPYLRLCYFRWPVSSENLWSSSPLFSIISFFYQPSSPSNWPSKIFCWCSCSVWHCTGYISIPSARLKIYWLNFLKLPSLLELSLIYFQQESHLNWFVILFTWWKLAILLQFSCPVFYSLECPLVR